MMPLPSNPSNQKSGVCPRKVDSIPGRQRDGVSDLRRRLRMQATVHLNPNKLRMKAIIRLGVALIIYAGGWTLLAEEPVEHEREELGVNPFTAPSVAEIFQQLDDLKPLPYEQLKREFPQAAHASREQIG